MDKALVRQKVSFEAELSTMPTAMASGKDGRIWASVSQQELLGRKDVSQKEQLSSSFRSGREPWWGAPHGCGVSGAYSELPSPYLVPHIS